MTLVFSAILSVGVLASVVYVVLKLVQSVIQFRNYAAVLNKFPQNPAKNPILGHLLVLPGLDDAGLKHQREMTGIFPICSLVWLGPFLPMVVVPHPETVKSILKTSEPKAGRIYNLIRPWVGDGLLLSKGSKWSRNRRLLTPAFHFDILKPYIAIKNRAADVLLNKLQRFSDRNEYFEVFSEISLFTLDVILRCAFSYDTDCQNIGTKHPYVKEVISLSWHSANRFFKPWIYSDWVYFLTPSGRKFKKSCDVVHKVAEEIIEKRREALASRTLEQEVARSKRCTDFLDILLTARDETGEGLSPREIRDETDTFLFEGHDTTASALSWTLYSLAEHQECQEAVYREIQDLMAKKTSMDIDMEDLAKLPYLTMCVKESLRFHSPVPFILRETTQDMTVDGHTVPKGTTEFQPERFAPENVENRDPYAFVPFSAGPRNCIGQNFAMHELKIALARMIHRFSFELDPNHKVMKKQEMVMRSETGIMMRVTPRRQSC